MQNGAQFREAAKCSEQQSAADSKSREEAAKCSEQRSAADRRFKEIKTEVKSRMHEDRARPFPGQVKSISGEDRPLHHVRPFSISHCKERRRGH